ncbi:HPr family phosphocarrier protein [Lachnospiraceae bacterium KGMB03038]|nr:HPr family phosphocarrier protein [Lachnospiraceae bacterium KGMB03038]
MIKKPVTIRTNMDMESRPIAHLVQEASQYASHVYIEMEDKKINAKSIMGMMSLDLLEGTSLTIVADGEDEENAVNGVGAFLENCK